VVCSIENEVLAHDSQTNEAEISSGNIVSMLGLAGDVRDPAGRPADVYPSKTLAGVRIEQMSGEIIRREAIVNTADAISLLSAAFLFAVRGWRVYPLRRQRWRGILNEKKRNLRWSAHLVILSIAISSQLMIYPDIPIRILTFWESLGRIGRYCGL
jgi:hypothetical protein